MEILTKQELEKIMGGRWIYFSDGTKVYIPDDEDDDEDDFIFP